MGDFTIQIDEEEDKKESESKSSESKKKNTSKPNFSLKSLKTTKAKLIIVVVVILAIVGGYFYQTRQINNLQAENQRLSDPQQAAQEEADRIKSEVSALIELPNETPTIATVVDVEKLRDQVFFSNAQNGDRVLLFAEAKKAVLYRPQTKKIIEVAPINIGDQQGSTAGDSTNQAN